MTTPSRPPLWRVMVQACAEHREDIVDLTPGEVAVMIDALADWLIPDDPAPDVVLESSPEAFTVYMAFHRQRMALRERLIAEADRAEHP